MASHYKPGSEAAVVIVGGELGGLGVVRSFARQKIPVIAVDSEPSRAALWSRHARGRLIRAMDGKAFVEDMIELGKEFESPSVLLLTAEQSVHAVSENRKELSKWFCFRLPTENRVKLLSSKADFHDFASQNRFPVPRSLILEKKSDIGLLRSLLFPCVLKPDDKRSVLIGKKERAVRVETLKEAQNHASVMLETPGRIIVQEWIEGAESNIYFTLFYRGSGGRVVAAFTGRKLACYPRDVGSTAVCIAAPDAREELERMTLMFAERADMDGMGSMEYKWDDNRRKFVMIEPTVGRTDWQEEIATLCGVNIPVAAYRHELGLPVDPISMSRTDVAWRGTLVEKPPRHLRSSVAKTVDGYFRWSDPWPAVKFYCLDHPLQRILRRWRRMQAFKRDQRNIAG